MVKESDYLVSNQEILGGLKTAISRGENLKDAMMTFYQAGYDKTEIEEAARAYLTEQSAGVPKMDVTKRELHTPESPQEEKIKEQNASSPQKSAYIPVVPQRVSSYEIPKKIAPKKNNTLTIVLILILFILLGVLVSIFLFKTEIVGFFNGLFD